MHPTDPVTLRPLSELVGQRVRFLGVVYDVIDVLQDGPCLVLENRGSTVIQADQYGGPQRRVPDMVTVPVIGEDGTGWHADFMSLERL